MKTTATLLSCPSMRLYVRSPLQAAGDWLKKGGDLPEPFGTHCHTYLATSTRLRALRLLPVLFCALLSYACWLPGRPPQPPPTPTPTASPTPIPECPWCSTAYRDQEVASGSWLALDECRNDDQHSPFYSIWDICNCTRHAYERGGRDLGVTQCPTGDCRAEGCPPGEECVLEDQPERNVWVCDVVATPTPTPPPQNVTRIALDAFCTGVANQTGCRVNMKQPVMPKGVNWPLLLDATQHCGNSPCDLRWTLEHPVNFVQTQEIDHVDCGFARLGPDDCAQVPDMCPNGPWKTDNLNVLRCEFDHDVGSWWTFVARSENGQTQDITVRRQ